MKTFSAKPHEVERKWYVIDAKGKILGQVAVEAARLLRGKHKPTFTSHVDTGDFVIVINAAKVKVTGNKMSQKKYYTHSGNPGSMKALVLEKAIAEKPELPIRIAVKGMLPKNVLGRQLITKLKVYPGADHPHAAQQPETLSV